MASGPKIELTQIKGTRDRISAQWRIVWALKNIARHPLQVVSVRFPHQQFKSGEHIFEPTIDLKEDAEIEFEQLIQCEARPGVVTENAFAIFYATRLDAPWRIFVRLKVVVALDGNPQATTELVTVQKAGFSGVES
jgi:hypothetical protein